MATLDKIQTLTIIAGTMACNADCPDCVSKMTTNPEEYKAIGFKDIDFENLEIAINIALSGGAGTVLFTGKGEPTLFPEQINKYLKFLNQEKFGNLAIKELQTNGLKLHDETFQKEGWLDRWYENGLRVVSLSVVDVDDKVNNDFYCPSKEYPPLEKTIEMLHDKGYSVRLSVTMVKTKVDSPDDVERVVKFCKENKVEQLSMRPMRKPSGETYAPEVAKYVEENELSKGENGQEADIVRHVKENAKLLRKLVHGGRVYDFRGQNLCLTDCLTVDPDEGARQIIFYTNGKIADDWVSEAAVIVGPGKKCRQYLKNGK
jgi:MoaA/NifB/PqqE/SkfB family radical SAM enzyme